MLNRMLRSQLFRLNPTRAGNTCHSSSGDVVEYPFLKASSTAKGGKGCDNLGESRQRAPQRGRRHQRCDRFNNVEGTMTGGGRVV